ncbi:MAG: hypothetical protein KatS3mg113_0390 [Planctomycetaceae bacterium]|nr:MAG: hypothetical protein KatS3mg113_0390 [Planctomycetaceae bacterium]
MASHFSLESFIELVQKSGLVDATQLAHALSEFRAQHPEQVTAGQLAAELVRRQLLTPWQAEKLLQGKHKGFFLGKYKLLGMLGRGGMSHVYLGEHLLMRRLCAIKVLPARRVHDASYLQRFIRESEAAARLDHPNIVRAYDIDHQVDRDVEIHYLVMEYVDGISLQDLVAQRGPLPVPEALEYIRQAAVGLAYAHQMGLVHRDIKPGNLLLDKQGVVKILDLGLARFYDPQDPAGQALTVQYDEKVLGTADYLAPEQAIDSHRVDARADLYSLGCTLYFLLTGHPPFPEGTLAQRLLAHQQKEPVPVEKERPDLPPEVVAIVRKLMAKRPEDRYASAAEVADVLLDWLRSHTTESWQQEHVRLLTSPTPSRSSQIRRIPQAVPTSSPGVTVEVSDHLPAAYIPPGSTVIATKDRPPQSSHKLANPSPIPPKPPAQTPSISDTQDATADGAVQKSQPLSPAEGVKSAKRVVARPVPAPPPTPVTARDQARTFSVDPESGLEEAPASIVPPPATAASYSNLEDSSTASSGNTVGVAAAPFDHAQQGSPSDEQAHAWSGWAPEQDPPWNDVVSKSTSASISTSVPPRSSSDNTQRRWIWMALGIATPVLLLGSWWFFTSPPSSTQPVKQSSKVKSSKARSPSSASSTPKTDPSSVSPWSRKREITVGARGDVATITEALQLVRQHFRPASRSDRFVIHLLPGTYQESLVVEGGGHSGETFPENVQVQGQSGVILAGGTGKEPLLRVRGVERFSLSDVILKGGEHAVVAQFEGELAGCRFARVRCDDIRHVGVKLVGARGYSFGDMQVLLEDWECKGGNTAIAVACESESTDQAESCRHVVLLRCRFLGPLACGLSIRGTQTQSLTIRECIFTECEYGVKFLDAAGWNETQFVHNTFYHCGYGVWFARQPAQTNKGLSFRRNLFVGTKHAETFIAEGFDEKQLLEHRMLGEIQHNWTDRSISQPDKPPPGEMVLFYSGRAGVENLQFQSTDPQRADFLRPGDNSPHRQVPKGRNDDHPWIGAVGP